MDLMSVDPVSFARGKRGVAGSLLFSIFDRKALFDLMRQSLYAAKAADLPAGGRSSTATAGFGIGTSTELSLVEPHYSDQIPPFNITLTARNEMGNAASMVIYGVEIVNEGGGHSIDDVTADAQIAMYCLAY